ncbi:MAG TPA: SMI1/KNR4 family protein [Gemmataceae bacterium]|jgi:cell wall assembly regulator SMI1|nr:SMI1/KNR4 family protein [Gemmataceae bacterium]
MNEITQLLTRLERWLKAQRPRFLEDLAPAAGVAELNELRSLLGGRLPDGLAALLSWHNGERPGAAGYFVEHWRLMSSDDIIEATTELKRPPARDRPEDRWDAAWIPFLDDDECNYTCLDSSRPGEPVREVIFGHPRQEAVASSLTAWLADFVAAVERGEYVEDEERGVFMRRK